MDLDSTDIHVGSAANVTLGGVVFNHASIVHNVHQALPRAPELAGGCP